MSERRMRQNEASSNRYGRDVEVAKPLLRFGGSSPNQTKPNQCPAVCGALRMIAYTAESCWPGRNNFEERVAWPIHMRLFTYIQ